MAEADYPAELWVTITGAADYSVSNLGKVRRDAPSTSPRGRAVVGRLLKHGRCGAGRRYARVVLYTNGKMQYASVHRLVCEAFHGPAPSAKHHAAHNDGDPLNNRADNLRWATAKENIADKAQHGTRLRGSRANGAKLNERQVRAIRKSAVPAGELAELLDLEESTINKIRSRRIWRWLE